MDPVDGILKPDARFRNYLIITFLFSVGATLLTFLGKVYGRSVSYVLKLSLC